MCEWHSAELPCERFVRWHVQRLCIPALAVSHISSAHGFLQRSALRMRSSCAGSVLSSAPPSSAFLRLVFYGRGHKRLRQAGCLRAVSAALRTLIAPLPLPVCLIASANAALAGVVQLGCVWSWRSGCLISGILMRSSHSDTELLGLCVLCLRSRRSLPRQQAELQNYSSGTSATSA